MWRRSFVATTVALGGALDDALAGMPALASRDAALEDFVARLRASSRSTRAGALAAAVRDIVVAIDRTTLR